MKDAAPVIRCSKRAITNKRRRHLLTTAVLVVVDAPASKKNASAISAKAPWHRREHQRTLCRRTVTWCKGAANGAHQ